MILYKYYSNIEYAKEVLRDSTLYFADVDTLNDPYEQLFVIRDAKTKQSYAVRDAKKSGRVCSFSQTPFSYLMWSYYAKNHSGVCLAVDFSPTIVSQDVESESTKCISGGIDFYLKHVSYDLFIPEVDTQERVSPFAETIRAFSNKLQCWSHEREVRAIARSELPQKVEIPKVCIKAIYYGWFGSTAQTELSAFIEQNQVNIEEYKMTMDLESEQMFFRPVLS